MKRILKRNTSGNWLVLMAHQLQKHCHSLWINDLLSMPHHPVVGKTFYFRGYNVKEVCIFGVITSVERVKMIQTFYVDDGTGVILCACNISRLNSKHKEVESLLDSYLDHEDTCTSSNMILMQMLERAINICDKNSELRLGDSLFIIGTISQCSEELRIITASFISPLRDLRSEIILMNLRKHFYAETSKLLSISPTKPSLMKNNSFESPYDCDNTICDDDQEKSECFYKQGLTCRSVCPWHEECFVLEEESIHEHLSISNNENISD